MFFYIILLHSFIYTYNVIYVIYVTLLIHIAHIFMLLYYIFIHYVYLLYYLYLLYLYNIKLNLTLFLALLNKIMYLLCFYSKMNCLCILIKFQ